MNYTVLHLHTHLSTAITNIDSVTKPEDYIEIAKALNMRALAFTEHGSTLHWYKKKQLCEKNGLKYIHGIEAYLTVTVDEKVRDNYHCCLYAKNYEGFKELNKMITKSFNRKDNHFYYVPRITLDELECTSDNIIVTSACCGGIFGKGSSEIKHRFLDFFINNKHRCYLEIQHHLDPIQINLNKELYKLAKENELNLIVGTDTHALNEVHAKGRTILQRSKNIFFSDEDKWDITFKTYDELVELYKQQNAIPMEEVLAALENTNKVADEIEPFEIDTSYKYPKLWDNPNELLREKIKQGIKDRHLDELPNYETEYLPRIKYELKTYEHNKAEDFLLLDEDIKSYAKRNGIYPGYGRGSVSGSLIAYIIGITDMDSIKHKLNFERFMNTERISLGDIDSDWSPNDREFIKRYLYNKEGLYCADIITFNTVALRGSIRDVCRALYSENNKHIEIANEICSDIETNEEYYRNKYKEVFEYVDIINGTIVSVGTHPCGVLVYDKSLDENIGLMTLSTCDYPVTMINMKEIDSQNFVKLDILSLDNVTLINETCKLANIERLTPDNVKDDIKVWESIRDNALGIFQWEGTGERYIKQLFSNETINNIKKRNPNFKYMDLFSVGNGAIRPAGASYREELAKGIFKDNGNQVLNEFLSPTSGYCIYQEQIIEFLNKFCGFTMGEADIIRRGFAKKTGTEQYIPKIKEGFIKVMRDKYNVSEEESEKLIVNFLQVIIDASDYLFSLNHSESYSYIGYICGYLRYYYPLEFLTVAFNIYKDDIEKTKKILDYANGIGINLKNPKFRYSKSDYFFDRESNSIFKGIGSIKYLNTTVGEYLYSLRDNTYESFIDLLIDLNGHIKSNQLAILIKTGFFEEFGKSGKLMKIYQAFDKLYGKKQISKEKYPMWNEIFSAHAEKETEKQFKVTDIITVLKEIENSISDEELDITDRVLTFIENIGYCDIKDESKMNNYLILDINKTKYNVRVLLYHLGTGKQQYCKIDKSIYKNNIINKNEVIFVDKWKKQYKRKEVDNKWVQTDEVEIKILEYWRI